MKLTKKYLIPVILAVILLFSIVPAALAADAASTSAADSLYSAGLFRGVATNPNGTPNYDLDRTLNRYEGMTMLVRLLGAEEAALSGSWYLPFDDVTPWARPYISYASAKSLTNGISETKFGGAANIKTSEYLTFICRALGYSDSIDFAWNSAWTLTDRIGVTHGEYRSNSRPFSRGDAVKVSLSALRVKMKNSDLTLIEYLYANGAVSEKAVCDILGVSDISVQAKEQKIYNDVVEKQRVFIDSIIRWKDFSQKDFTDKEAVLLLPDSSEKGIFDFHNVSFGEGVASISDVEKSVNKLFGKTVDIRKIKSDFIRISGENVFLPARTGVGVIQAELVSVKDLGNNDYAITFNYKVGSIGDYEKYTLTVNYSNGNIMYKGFERANYN